MEYDFSVLNDRDFEALVTDLLGELYGGRIERFKPGRDQGVDGRWFLSPGNEAIIQCKRWIATTFPAFMSELKSKEKPKIDRLSPKKYILATTLPLSRDNKDKIVALLNPYVISSSDIFGREDIHDLLVKHPAVERRHPKLWVATATVIGRIINAGLVGRAGFVLDEIQDFARRYVDTSDCASARELLREKRALIIKGGAGVGKTTLANQMLCEYTANGYEPYVIEDVAEAENIFDDSIPQFFLYDDFLGSNFLEIIQNKEDSRIVSFIRRVLRYENKVLVLTTRSHILNQGKDCSEALRLHNTSRREIELQVGNISDLDKAKILYSHMFAGGMPDYALDAIYESHRYIKLVRHDNFNPRLVSFITDPDRFCAIDHAEYWDYVQNSFDYPAEIWRHVFERQISKDAGTLGFLVYANGRGVSERELKVAFASLVNEESTGWEFSLRFDSALKIAVGSILNRVIIRDVASASVTLFNPSVGDFLEAEVLRLDILRNLVVSLETTAGVRNLDSLRASGIISLDAQIAILKDIVGRAALRAPVSDAVVKAMCRLGILIGNWSLVKQRFHELEGYIDVAECSVLEDLLDLLVVAFENDDETFFEIADKTLGRLDEERWDVSESTMEAGVSLALRMDAIHPGERYTKACDGVIDVWENNISQWAHDADILADFSDPGDAYIAREKLEEFILERLRSIGLDAGTYEVKRVSRYVDVEDVLYSNFKSTMSSDDEREAASPVSSSTSEIIDYFGDRRL